MGIGNEQTPKTISEIGIHIGYIRDELIAINKVLNAVPSSTEVRGLDKRLLRIEKIIGSIRTKIITAAVTMLVLMILAQYGLDKYFS